MIKPDYEQEFELVLLFGRAPNVVPGPQNLRCGPGVPFPNRSERGPRSVFVVKCRLGGRWCTATIVGEINEKQTARRRFSLSLSLNTTSTKACPGGAPVGAVLLKG